MYRQRHAADLGLLSLRIALASIDGAPLHERVAFEETATEPPVARAEDPDWQTAAIRAWPTSALDELVEVN